MFKFSGSVASLLAVPLVLSSPLAALADERYEVIRAGDKTGVEFQIAYTAGVHKGVASDMTSTVVLDDNGQLKSAEFRVPIASMKTGNVTRDCHMREALGINYEGSKFPNEHVCDSNNTTPASGPDSVVFPEIIFSFTTIQTAAGQGPLDGLEVGKPVSVLVSGTYTIHGQTKSFNGDSALPIQIELADTTTRELRLIGKFNLSLKDFGVVVKPFKLGPIKVTVDDKAKIALDLKLAPTK